MRNVLLILFLVLTFYFLGKTLAQDSVSVAGINSGTFIAMPMINNNPVMKTSFGVLSMYMFSPNKADTISPPSTFMFMGLYSTNNSYIFALPAALFLKNDDYRIMAVATTSRLNNDFTYEIEEQDVPLVYSEIRWIYFVEFSYKVWDAFYAGALYSGFKTNYKFNNGSDEENNFTESLFTQLGIKENFTSSLGLKLSYDTRDYIYNSSAGICVTARAMYFAKWLGSENEYSNVVYDVRQYFRINETSVLAYMLSGGNSFGDVPFSGYQAYGLRSTLRGYPTGKYRGKNLLALQAEYRWNFYGRWGLVGFAGAGTIWGGKNERTDEMFQKELLPGIGGGIRFMLSEERQINARLDYAWGVDGNEGVYLSIMEAF